MLLIPQILMAECYGSWHTKQKFWSTALKSIVRKNYYFSEFLFFFEESIKHF